MAKCHKLRLSNKNRQELLKGKKGAKNTRASLFFPNSNAYLNWDTFLSSNFVMLFHFRENEIIQLKKGTVFIITDSTNLCMLRSSINIQLARMARKILVTFATFAIFADISGPFLVSSFSRSGILLHLLFLRFLRYFSRVFLARKKNRCYFRDFCDNCGHFGALLGFFFF